VEQAFSLASLPPTNLTQYILTPLHHVFSFE
jgi:hypothetical protein